MATRELHVPLTDPGRTASVRRDRPGCPRMSRRSLGRACRSPARRNAAVRALGRGPHSGVAAGGSRGHRGRGIEVGAAKPEDVQVHPEVLVRLPDPFHTLAPHRRRCTRVARPHYRDDLVDLVAERPVRECTGGSRWRSRGPTRAGATAIRSPGPPGPEAAATGSLHPAQQSPIVAAFDGPAARPANDSWIAACFLARELPLATVIIKDFVDFEQHEGLQLLR